jgi:hypothetical protein
MMESREMVPKIPCGFKKRLTQTGFADAQENIIYLSLNRSGRAERCYGSVYAELKTTR